MIVTLKKKPLHLQTKHTRHKLKLIQFKEVFKDPNNLIKLNLNLTRLIISKKKNSNTIQ